MKSLLDEMKQCKSIKECHEIATIDAYGDYEQASSWLTCIEEMFGKFDRVKVLEQEVVLEKFDLVNESSIVAICKKGKQRAKIALESIEFPKLTKVQVLWLNAWKKWANH